MQEGLGRHEVADRAGRLPSRRARRVQRRVLHVARLPDHDRELFEPAPHIADQAPRGSRRPPRRRIRRSAPRTTRSPRPRAESFHSGKPLRRPPGQRPAPRTSALVGPTSLPPTADGVHGRLLPPARLHEQHGVVEAVAEHLPEGELVPEVVPATVDRVADRRTLLLLRAERHTRRPRPRAPPNSSPSRTQPQRASNLGLPAAARSAAAVVCSS